MKLVYMFEAVYDDFNVVICLQLVLKPYHMAVFSVELTAPDHEGTFSAEVIIDTQFEVSAGAVVPQTVFGSFRKWKL